MLFWLLSTKEIHNESELLVFRILSLEKLILLIFHTQLSIQLRAGVFLVIATTY